MALETVNAAAATAVLNYDLMQNSPFRQNSSRGRTLHGVAYTGSAVVGDTQIEIKAGATTIARLFNSKLLTADREDMFGVGEMIPAGVVISAIIIDAPATSIVYLVLDLR